MYLSYSVRNEVFPENIISIFQSFFYLHIPADNPVFWTLRVEAEYYVFVGLLFPLLVKYPRLSSYILMPALLLSSQVLELEIFRLSYYLVYFIIGILLFLFYDKLIIRRDFFC